MDKTNIMEGKRYVRMLKPKKDAPLKRPRDLVVYSYLTMVAGYEKRPTVTDVAAYTNLDPDTVQTALEHLETVALQTGMKPLQPKLDWFFTNDRYQRPPGWHWRYAFSSWKSYVAKQNTNLTALTAMLYSWLLNKAKSGKMQKPTNILLATVLLCDRDTIPNLWKRLEECGLFADGKLLANRPYILDYFEDHQNKAKAGVEITLDTGDTTEVCQP